MFACQWHFDVPFGKQGNVITVMKAWGEDSAKSSDFRLARSSRICVGHVGVSASHVIVEHLFESLADFEAALKTMSQPQFKAHAEALAPFVVAGTQRWEIHRIVE